MSYISDVLLLHLYYLSMLEDISYIQDVLILHLYWIMSGMSYILKPLNNQ